MFEGYRRPRRRRKFGHHKRRRYGASPAQKRVQAAFKRAAAVCKVGPKSQYRKCIKIQIKKELQK